MISLTLTDLLLTFLSAKPRLEASARVKTGSQATAQDLIQDTWLKLEAVSDDTKIVNLQGFIAQIAKNTVLDHVRKERRRGEIDDELNEILGGSNDDVSPERHVIGRQSLEMVKAALADMPSRTREIFLLNRIDGVSHRQIAKRLQISDEAVYYHIRRAIERLARIREELEL